MKFYGLANEEYQILEDDQELEEYKDGHLSYIDAKIRFKNEFQFPQNDNMPLTDLSKYPERLNLKTSDKGEISVNKQQILNYINLLSDMKTKKLTLEKFEKITIKLDEIFKELKNELFYYEN